MNTSKKHHYFDDEDKLYASKAAVRRRYERINKRIGDDVVAEFEEEWEDNPLYDDVVRVVKRKIK
jgi:hypothetical protein